MSPLSRLNATTLTSLLPKAISYLSLMLYSVDTSYHHESEENALELISVCVTSQRIVDATYRRDRETYTPRTLAMLLSNRE